MSLQNELQLIMNKEYVIILWESPHEDMATTICINSVHQIPKTEYKPLYSTNLEFRRQKPKSVKGNDTSASR